eukprot:14103691-Alexandrium_andersonii.AAC.1
MSGFRGGDLFAVLDTCAELSLTPRTVNDARSLARSLGWGRVRLCSLVQMHARHVRVRASLTTWMCIE